MSIGIIGIGKMGISYLAQIIERSGIRAHEVIIWDIVPERLASVAITYPGIRIASSFEEFASNAHIFVVAVNTPAHYDVIRGLAMRGAKHVLCESGVTNILCEKPLAQTLVQIRKIRALEAQFPKLTIHTALVIQFSPVFDALREIMEREDLVLREFSGYWGKNRGISKEKRPTAGDRTDEFLWMLEACIALLRPHELISATVVSAMVGFLDYADAEAQRRAHERDESFPLRPDNSTRVHISFESGAEGDVRADFASSFLLAEQERRVAGVLAKRGADEPVILFKADFDCERGIEVDGEKKKDKFDRLVITRCQTDVKEVRESRQDNLGALTQAFVDFARCGSENPNLAPVAQASLCVGILEAIKEVDVQRRNGLARFITIKDGADERARANA